MSPETVRPTISVVVPAYNAAATLPECLRRLLVNPDPSCQVIVVDDCSTDDTAAIAARCGARVVQLAEQSGAAVARNVGAAHATADILFFVDADVMVAPDTVEHVIRLLGDRPEISAVFGSYTAATVHTNFCSVYKNLMHHLTHQAAHPEARTFWSGAGAIRTEAFWAVGGFDPADTRTADVEDIALGYRLTRAGYRIRLDRDMQVTHAKYYGFMSLIRSDVVHRAIPWTRLMMRERMFQHDLNTTSNGLVSSLAVVLIGPMIAAAVLFHPGFALVAAFLFLLYLILNRRLFQSFAHYDRRIVVPAIGMTALYYIYAPLGAAIGFVLYLRRPHPSPRLERNVGWWESLAVSLPSWDSVK